MAVSPVFLRTPDLAMLRQAGAPPDGIRIYYIVSYPGRKATGRMNQHFLKQKGAGEVSRE